MAALGIRVLGSQGLRVSEIGLGCVGISELYGPREPDESRTMLRRALDLGVNFFDTADVYGAGHNEEFVGRAITGRRQEVVLATKCGFVWDGQGEITGLDGSPQHIYEACEASLRRLRVEVIDLY